MFVIGPTLQFTSDGKVIPKEEQTYVWIPYILKKFKVLTSVSPITALPEVDNPLKSVSMGLKKICGDNFISGMFVLGMQPLFKFIFMQLFVHFMQQKQSYLYFMTASKRDVLCV